MTAHPCISHDWTYQPDQANYACTDCETTTPPCNTCTRPNQNPNHTCNRCLTRAATVLDGIAEAAQTPMAPTLGIQAIRYDRDKQLTKPGEQPLPAGLQAHQQDDPTELVAISAGTGRTVLELMRDPADVLSVLFEWANHWSTARNNTWQGSVIAWLKRHHTWAANNPDTSGWHDYLTETRTIRRRVRALVGLAPEHEAAPCVHCGAQVIANWTDTGLEDARHCTGCGTTWGQRADLAYVNLTTLRALPETHPDTLVTLEDARTTMPGTKRNTINQRLKRDRERARDGAARLIPEHGTNRRGEPLYRLADLTNMERSTT